MAVDEELAISLFQTLWWAYGGAVRPGVYLRLGLLHFVFESGHYLRKM